MKFPKLFGKKTEKRAEITQETVDCVLQALSFGTIQPDYSNRSISAVYRAVEIISDSIAVLPVKVRKRNANHTEDIPEHPIHFALNNNTSTRYNLMKMLVESVMLRGNGYAYIERGEAGQPIALRYLNPSEVTVNYNKNKNTLWYKVANLPVGRIEPINMIHLVKNTNDGVNGISIISYASRALGLANATEQQAKGFFENGCNLSGVLTVQGQLTAQQRKDIYSSWNQAFMNGGNGLAVIPGNMQYQPITINAADAQMLESRKFNVQDIARFFGLSPVLLGDSSSSSFPTIEALQNDFLLHTLAPYIEMIEQEFNRKLVLPSEMDLEIKLDEAYLLRTDKTAQAQYYTSMLDKGVFCINEVRRELGFTPIDGGDKHVIPYTDLSQNVINDDTKTDEQ